MDILRINKLKPTQDERLSIPKSKKPTQTNSQSNRTPSHDFTQANPTEDPHIKTEPHEPQKEEEDAHGNMRKIR